MADKKLETVTVAHASFWYTDEDGRNRVALRGDEIEVNGEDHARGAASDAFRVPEAEEPAEAAAEEQPASDKIEDILEAVGSDADRAAAALATEQAKGEKARSSLVAKLEAIANPGS